MQKFFKVHSEESELKYKEQMLDSGENGNI